MEKITTLLIHSFLDQFHSERIGRSSISRPSTSSPLRGRTDAKHEVRADVHNTVDPGIPLGAHFVTSVNDVLMTLINNVAHVRQPPTVNCAPSVSVKQHPGHLMFHTSAMELLKRDPSAHRSALRRDWQPATPILVKRIISAPSCQPFHGFDGGCHTHCPQPPNFLRRDGRPSCLQDPA